MRASGRRMRELLLADKIDREAMEKIRAARPGEVPVLSFHGIDDESIHYTFDTVIIQPPIDNLEFFGSYYVAELSTRFGNQKLHDRHFNDKYTSIANSKNHGFTGLFPFYGKDNAFEPWAWYDSTTNCSNGTGSPFNPNASKQKAKS